MRLKIYDDLLDRLNDIENEHTQHIKGGIGCKDFAEYKYRIGIIRGLEEARNIITEYASRKTMGL